jgi:hypothetical protein
MKSFEVFDDSGKRFFVGREAMASALTAKPHQIKAMRKVNSVIEVKLDEGLGEGETTWIVHPLTGECSGPHSTDASKAEARDNLLAEARADAQWEANGGDAGDDQ